MALPWRKTALPYAEDLARTHGAEGLLVHAAPRRGGYVAAVSEAAYVDALAAEAFDAEITAYLAAVASKLRAEGVGVRWRVLYRPPAEGIEAPAQQTPQSLIALTTRGHSALAHWFFGSVAAGMVRRADTPVLVIPQHYSQQYAARIAALLAKTPPDGMAYLAQHNPSAARLTDGPVSPMMLTGQRGSGGSRPRKESRPWRARYD